MITIERLSDHEDYPKVTDSVLLHVKHSLSAAEAKRLAINTGLTTHVLRSIAKYIPKSEVEVVPS